MNHGEIGNMSQAPFHFKEFSVSQDKTAMKVGTDGVLLGAWVQVSVGVDSILDIGTGTGLIALQLAQRCDCPVIDGLEIEPNAFEQAVENFENSPWSDRLFCYHASLQDFEKEMDESYDLIVCNPPFFNNSFPAELESRNLARQGERLEFETLLKCTAAVLSPEGSCAFVLPFDLEKNFLAIAKKYGLAPSRITRVKGSPDSPVKRSLVQLNKTSIQGTDANQPDFSDLTIETSRHVYTDEYRDLVKDFYLKM